MKAVNEGAVRWVVQEEGRGLSVYRVLSYDVTALLRLLQLQVTSNFQNLELDSMY